MRHLVNCKFLRGDDARRLSLQKGRKQRLCSTMSNTLAVQAGAQAVLVHTLRQSELCSHTLQLSSSFHCSYWCPVLIQKYGCDFLHQIFYRWLMFEFLFYSSCHPRLPVFSTAKLLMIKNHSVYPLVCPGNIADKILQQLCSLNHYQYGWQLCQFFSCL